MRKHCCGNICEFRCFQNVYLFARAHNICYGHTQCKKMFLNLFRNILLPKQMFSCLLAKETMLTRFLNPGLLLHCTHNITCSRHLFPMKCFFLVCPLVCSPKTHYEQQCFCNNVSLFAIALNDCVCLHYRQEKTL